MQIYLLTITVHNSDTMAFNKCTMAGHMYKIENNGRNKEKKYFNNTYRSSKLGQSN